MKVNFWTEEEDKIICEHYHHEGVKATQRLIPWRTEKAVMTRAHKLGVMFSGSKQWQSRAISFDPVDLTIHYQQEVTEGPRRVYSMDSERNHVIQKSHPVRKVIHGYSSCHTALEMAA